MSGLFFFVINSTVLLDVVVKTVVMLSTNSFSFFLDKVLEATIMNFVFFFFFYVTIAIGDDLLNF